MRMLQAFRSEIFTQALIAYSLVTMLQVFWLKPRDGEDLTTWEIFQYANSFFFPSLIPTPNTAMSHSQHLKSNFDRPLSTRNKTVNAIWTKLFPCQEKKLDFWASYLKSRACSQDKSLTSPGQSAHSPRGFTRKASHMSCLQIQQLNHKSFPLCGFLVLR